MHLVVPLWFHKVAQFALTLKYFLRKTIQMENDKFDSFWCYFIYFIKIFKLILELQSVVFQVIVCCIFLSFIRAHLVEKEYHVREYV